jgi:hypothetical protein
VLDNESERNYISNVIETLSMLFRHWDREPKALPNPAEPNFLGAGGAK